MIFELLDEYRLTHWWLRRIFRHANITHELSTMGLNYDMGRQLHVNWYLLRATTRMLRAWRRYIHVILIPFRPARPVFPQHNDIINTAWMPLYASWSANVIFFDLFFLPWICSPLATQNAIIISLPQDAIYKNFRRAPMCMPIIRAVIVSRIDITIWLWIDWYDAPLWRGGGHYRFSTCRQLLSPGCSRDAWFRWRRRWVI